MFSQFTFDQFNFNQVNKTNETSKKETSETNDKTNEKEKNDKTNDKKTNKELKNRKVSNAFSSSLSPNLPFAPSNQSSNLSSSLLYIPSNQSFNPLHNPQSDLLNIKLPGIEINGYFVEGILKEGTVKKDGIIFKGIFNSDMLLHGHSTLEYKGCKYIGEFINGVLINGITLNSEDILIEKGIYTSNRNKIPQLINGSRLILLEQKILEGDFTDDNLLKGNIITADRIITGIFNKKSEKTLYQLLPKYKTIDYDNCSEEESNKKIKLISSKQLRLEDIEDIKRTFVQSDDFELFICKYKIDRVNFLANETLELYSYCNVVYNGPLELLSKELFIMLCCNGLGTETTIANHFYIKYLYNFDQLFIKSRLSPELFTNLTPLEKEALKIIMNNLTNYNFNIICPCCIINLQNSKISSDYLTPVYFKPQA